MCFPQSAITVSKVDIRRTSDRTIILQSHKLDVLPRHRNMISNKGLIIFDDYATKYVHLTPQEQECTSSFLGGSKMYISETITNSQGMLTEKNKNDVIAKLRILVKKLVL